MLLNGTALNVAPLNGSSGGATISFSATIATVQGVSGNFIQNMALIGTFSGAAGLLGTPTARLVASLGLQSGLVGTPRALLAATMGTNLAVVPQLQAKLAATLQVPKTITNILTAQLSATAALVSGIAFTLTIRREFSATLAAGYTLAGNMSGMWSAGFYVSKSLQGEFNLTQFFSPVVAITPSIDARLTAELRGTIAQVAAFAGTFNIILPTSVAFYSSQTFAGTSRALLTASAANSFGVQATPTMRVFRSATFSLTQNIVPSLYRYQDPTRIGSTMSVVCHIAISGFGKKTYGKIAMDVQRPYLGERVS